MDPTKGRTTKFHPARRRNTKVHSTKRRNTKVHPARGRKTKVHPTTEMWGGAFARFRTRLAYLLFVGNPPPVLLLLALWLRGGSPPPGPAAVQAPLGRGGGGPPAAATRPQKEGAFGHSLRRLSYLLFVGPHPGAAAIGSGVRRGVIPPRSCCSTGPFRAGGGWTPCCSNTSAAGVNPPDPATPHAPITNSWT